MAKKEKIKKNKEDKKNIKNLKAKKLPKLFKKSYSPKKFEKKLLRHVYIPADRELILSIFATGNNQKKPENYSVNKELLFSKKEIKKYKKLAKEIKSHKGRINGAAFIAAFSLIAAIVCVGFFFKDVLVKKGIEKGCESIFNAKSSVEYVKLNLFNSSLTVKNLKVGNSNQEFKNLFELGTVVLDFDINEALRGRFVTDNLECSDMKFNTERTSSCKLPEKKQKSKKEKDVVPEISSEVENETKNKFDFTKALNEKKSASVGNVQNDITSVLGGTDIETIKENILGSLSSPQAIETAKEDVNKLVDKWSSKPKDVEKEVTDFYKATQELATLDIKKIKDVKTLKKDVELITDAINKGNSLKDEVVTISKDIQTDSVKVKNIYSDIEKGIKADLEYTKNTFGSVEGLKNTASDLLENTIFSVFYQLAENYYPYVEKGINYAKTLKENSSKDGGKKVKKETKSNRMKGTTIYYKADNPEFLIKKLYASGKGFSGTISEITNNQNIRNIPTSVKCSFDLNNISHSADLVVDARQNSNSALITANYEGKGFNLDFDGTTIAKKSGMPSVKGGANITLKGSADEGLFKADGFVNMKKLALTSDGFENETLTKYYQKALASVTSLSFGYNFAFQQETGVSMNLTGDFANQFANSLTSLANEIGQDAKNAAYDMVNEYLNTSYSDFGDLVKQFNGLQDEINNQKNKVEKLQKDLENKSKDMQKQIQNMLNDTAKKAVNETTKAVTEAANQLEKDVKKKAEEGAKNFLKGIVK